MSQSNGRMNSRTLFGLTARIGVGLLSVVALILGTFWARSYWSTDSVTTNVLREEELLRKLVIVNLSRGEILVLWEERLSFDHDAFLAEQRYLLSQGMSHNRWTRWHVYEPTDLPRYRAGQPKFLKHGFMWDHSVDVS